MTRIPRPSFAEMRARRFDMLPPLQPAEPEPKPKPTGIDPEQIRSRHLLDNGRAIETWDRNQPVPYSREPKSIHSPAGSALVRFAPPVPKYARTRKRFAQS